MGEEYFHYYLSESRNLKFCVSVSVCVLLCVRDFMKHHILEGRLRHLFWEDIYCLNKDFKYPFENRNYCLHWRDHLFHQEELETPSIKPSILFLHEIMKI